jgi:osmoprotectant transport system ATP-binding protein
MSPPAAPPARSPGGAGIPDSAIRLAGVVRAFAGRRVLGPLDLEAPAGRTLVLLGPSGCGKSTLLRLLVGLAVPDAGTIELLGTPLAAATLPALRLRTGYVIQEGGLFPHLSAADNVALVAREQGWSRERITQRLNDLAELVHLPSEALARLPGELSGGQRQRVALMRALALDPELLLLDEPLGALDPMIRRRLRDDLGELFRRLGKTVLFVTHDLAEAAALGDEVVLLREGAIVQRGPWRDLVDRPADAFVREFVAAQSLDARAARP